MAKKSFNEYLKVGIVQPIVNESTAWPDSPSVCGCLKMNAIDAHFINNQISSAVNAFMGMEESERPNIIILPELCAADESFLENLAKKSNAIIITGRDFMVSGKEVKNMAEVFIPSKWENPVAPSTFCQKFFFGKKFFSYPEKALFKKFQLEGVPSPEIYILNARQYGRIGFAICADFFDILRFRIYKRFVHHLFILALNKDTETFEHMAETISRMVFCNVVVCNSGHYGGSLAFSPYKEAYKRYIYLHRGEDLFTSQVVSLPVQALDDFQQNSENIPAKDRLFKSVPPGYKYPDYNVKKEPIQIDLPYEQK